MSITPTLGDLRELALLRGEVAGLRELVEKLAMREQIAKANEYQIGKMYQRVLAEAEKVNQFFTEPQPDDGRTIRGMLIDLVNAIEGPALGAADKMLIEGLKEELKNANQPLPKL